MCKGPGPERAAMHVMRLGHWGAWHTHADPPCGPGSRGCAEPRGPQGGQMPAPAALGGADDLGQEAGIAGSEQECERGVGALSCSAHLCLQ